MEKMTIDQYLQERWKPQYEYHSRCAARSKRRFQFIRTLEIILAASLPFLNSLPVPDTSGQVLNFIVSLEGILITILAGLLLLYKYQESWVESRITAEALKTERILYLTRTAVYKTGDPEEKFIERTERILAGETRDWAKEMRELEEK